LETEVTNSGALALYHNLGFVKDKRLAKYYMNGVDAVRLKLFLLLDPQLIEQLEQINQSNGTISKQNDSKIMKQEETH
jgi:peptide alpha-N-acetyltransferase